MGVSRYGAGKYGAGKYAKAPYVYPEGIVSTDFTFTGTSLIVRPVAGDVAAAFTFQGTTTRVYSIDGGSSLVSGQTGDLSALFGAAGLVPVSPQFQVELFMIRTVLVEAAAQISVTVAGLASRISPIAADALVFTDLSGDAYAGRYWQGDAAGNTPWVVDAGPENTTWAIDPVPDTNGWV